MKKILKAGIVLCVVGFGAAALIGKNLKKEDLKEAQIYFNKYSNLDEKDAIDYNFDEAFAFSEAKNLQIDNVFGEIQITESRDNQLHVNLVSRIHKDQKPLDSKKIIYKDGDVVHVNLVDLFADKNGSNFIQINNQSITISKTLKVKIEIPAQYKKIKIDTVSGDVDIKNIQVDDISVDTVSGDLHFENSKFEKAKINTVSGDSEFDYTNDVPDLALDMTSVSGDLEGDEYFEKMIHEHSLKIGKQSSVIHIDSISGDVKLSKKVE